MIVRTEKIPKPDGFGIFVSNLNRKNESALGELGSATCGLQTVLPDFLVGKSIGTTRFFALAVGFNPTLNPGGSLRI